jgi:hypothetical protein
MAPSRRQSCHNVAVHTVLANAELTETFNADYYLAVVTVLPILMVSVELFTNLNKTVSIERTERWPVLIRLLLVFFYLFSPVISAVGVIVGVLALLYRAESSVYQWTVFACMVSVLIFLALSMTAYLLAFDTAQTAQERKIQERKASEQEGASDPEGPAS